MVDGLSGLPTQDLTEAGDRPARGLVEPLQKWFDVRTRYLTWTDGRLAQMVIATDITARRHAEEQAALQAEKAETAQPPHDDGRDGVVGGARTEPAADRHQQLLQRHDLAREGSSRSRNRPARRAGKDRQAGAARRPDHPPHPRLRETQRTQPHPVGRVPDRRATRSNSPTSTCAASNDPDEHLRGAAPAPAHGGPDPDRAGAHQPHEERGRGDRQRAAAPGPAPHRTACVTPTRRWTADAVEFSVTDTGPGIPAEKLEPASTRPSSHQGRRHGHRPEPVPLHRRVAPRQDASARTSTMGEITGCEFSFWIPVAPVNP
jgi:hypothetical protein